MSNPVCIRSSRGGWRGGGGAGGREEGRHGRKDEGRERGSEEGKLKGMGGEGVGWGREGASEERTDGGVVRAHEMPSPQTLRTRKGGRKGRKEGGQKRGGAEKRGGRQEGGQKGGGCRRVQGSGFRA